MSFQYIAYRYTSAPSGGQPEDVTIHTTGLEEDMQAWLENASRYKKPANIGIVGPQYTYRLHTWKGREYHILSCVRSAKHDATLAKGVMAHHFVLTPEEVETLASSSARPTPAGLILALGKCGIWQTGTPGETPDVDREPKLTAADLPDASAQSTWRKLTGNGDNAKTLLMPPYANGCLIMVPAPTDVREVLMLLHESDWQSTDHGWGRTFTTYGTAEDEPEALERVAIPIISSLPIEDGWKKTPQLCVNERLDLDNLEEAPPIGAEPARQPAQVKRERIHPTDPVPYRYVEVPDSEMFNVPFRRINPFLRYGVCLIFLLTLAAAINVLVCTTVEPETAKAKHEQTSPRTHTGKRQTESKERAAVYHGRKVPACLPGLLTKTGGNITLQSLGFRGERIKGTVISTEPIPNGVALHVLDKTNTRHRADVTWYEGLFNTVSVQGRQMALHINAPEYEIILMPMIRLEFPQQKPVRLPEVTFNIQPKDLRMMNGRLHCAPVHGLNRTVPTQWKKPLFIDLPFFPGLGHAVTCHVEPNAPYSITFGTMLQKMSIKRLSLTLEKPNPCSEAFVTDFDILANIPQSPAVSTATISHLYELAEKMKAGDFTLELEKEYKGLYACFHQDIPLPDYEERAECGLAIQEALCVKFNREFQKNYERAREQKDLPFEPLVLELNNISFVDSGAAIHWVFVLYVDDEAAPDSAP